jgi:hypothetical protein
LDSKAADKALAGRSDVAYLAKGFPGCRMGEVNFVDRYGQGSDGIG